MALKDITDKVAPVWQALKGIATGSKIISSEWNTVIENVAERTQFLRRRGVCDWDSTLSYAAGDFVQVAGVVYKALATNANKAPSSNPTYWEKCLMVAGEIAYTNEPEANGTASAGTAGKYARGDHVHPTDTSRAPLASPALTGTPTAPTAAVDTSTTQVATTAFVTNQASATTPLVDGTAAVGTSKRYARADHVHPTDTSRAPVASPALTGTPTAPTATDGTNTTQIANTAFVQSAVGGYLLKSGQTGGTVKLTESEASNPIIAVTGTLTSNLTVVLPATVKRLWAIYNATSGAYTVTVKLASGSGVTVAQGKRNLVYTDGSNVYDGFNDFESVALTGAPTAPTAAVDTSTTQVATTAFVTNQASATTPIVDGTAAVGTSKRYARGDHVHPTDTTRAAVSSFANSKATSGWQKLEGGLIIQWGTVSFAPNNMTKVEATVTYPIAFPNACVHISGVQTSRASVDGGGSWAMRPTMKTLTNFLATLDNNAGNALFNFTLAQTAEWIAIGY